uniref:C2H2-type domain-containing protein n=1 Tax=Gouania willdenowi TaxID=441366 RepID=A0A8C5EKQ2_GOUWI
MDKEDGILSQERRLSKRTPKPKIIYSCNYCGHEFRDKTPLDVHVQRYHSKDTPNTLEADASPNNKEEAEDQCKVTDSTPIRMAPKRTLSRFQLKCPNCEFRGSTEATLESHVLLKHPDQEWYRCKACNYFSPTVELMEAHLSLDNHVERVKREQCAEASSFKACVETVTRDTVVDDVTENPGGEEMPLVTETKVEANQAAEDVMVVLDEEDNSELEPPRKKSGGPKQGSTTTCGYCGLVMSNATNLGVHIRRKHSKDYAYNCTLCNYSCVTKGDMDRHCITKKHSKRVQECSVSYFTEASLQDKTSTQELKPTAASETSDNEQPGDSTVAQEQNAEEHSETDTGQWKSQHAWLTACSLCDFVAHSILSLHLHFKKKHTRDFEYVCLACSYYAITAREMCRHANTEKHKQKSQKYLELHGSQGQSMLAVPSKPKVVAELQGATSVSGSLNLTEISEPTSSKSLVREINTTAVGCVTTESDVGKSAESVVAPGPTDGPESDHLQSPRLDQSTTQENQNINSKEAKSQQTIEDAQMPSNISFDASIVSIKSLAEHTLQEGVLDGDVAVLCLADRSLMPSIVSSPNSAFVKKVKPKVMKEETKGSSSRIRCEDCGFMADGISGLNVHISMKHPSKERHFHCLVCGKSFYTESNLHQHLSSAAHLRNEQNSVEELPEGGSTFKCVKCTDRFKLEQDLFLHIKEKHEELLREVNKYVVEDTEQINREREENQGSVCKHCGKVCKSSNSMAFLAHIRTHTGSKPFKCKICKFATAQLGDARNHVKRHLGMREYKCGICGWAFVMKKHLSTHLLGKHGIGQRKERKFECELCDRSFSEKWALNNHMKLHSGEKPYKCAWPSCHYAFLNLSAMKDHYRTHTGEKSYLCDLCGFAGGTKHALTKHRRQHTGERPFKCKICNFASTTQSHLSRHKRVHTGEKPYRCPWCEYRSNCAENIRKHILHTGKHVDVKMYNCPKCSYATNSPMEFRNHLKEHHPDIENPDLAYLHAGIVSKSFDCRLKGQGATFVESGESPTHSHGSLEALSHDGPIQQVIIIQGYGDGEVAIDQTLEESAAATLQTLAMSGQVAEVLHITEDGQVIASGREVASSGAHLAGGGTQYVVLESGKARKDLQAAAKGRAALEASAGQSHIISESSTALDALLSAVSEMGHQEEIQGEATVVHEVLQGDEHMQEKQEQVQIIRDAGQEEMQEVLQLAASQMMKEGLTQVIVNDEGTHYIVTELDNCTLQVEEGMYGEAAVGDGEAQQAEQHPEEEMVVYVGGAHHNMRTLHD